MIELVVLALIFVTGIGVGVFLSALFSSRPKPVGTIPTEWMPYEVGCPLPPLNAASAARSDFAPKPKRVSPNTGKIIEEFKRAKYMQPQPRPEPPPKTPPSTHSRLPPIDWN